MMMRGGQSPLIQVPNSQQVSPAVAAPSTKTDQFPNILTLISRFSQIDIYILQFILYHGINKLRIFVCFGRGRIPLVIGDLYYNSLGSRERVWLWWMWTWLAWSFLYQG